MDPITIAVTATKAAQTLFEAAKTIYKFAKDAHDLDDTVSGLHGQIKGLAQLLSAISSALNDLELQSAGHGHSELWDHVGTSVQAVNETVARLNREMKPLEKAGSNAVAQAWRLFRLRLKQNTIEPLLAEMRTYSVNLQLAMGMITL